MDKFEKILDIIDHQEKYSDAEIREILQDEECRKLYQTMQEVDSALLKQEAKSKTSEDDLSEDKVSLCIDVDAEWEKFRQEHFNEYSVKNTDSEKSEGTEVIPMRPATRFSWRKIAAAIVGFVLISGITFAAIHTYISKRQQLMPIAEDMQQEMVKAGTNNNTTKVTSSATENAKKPVVHKTFENVSLHKIMTEIATYYDLQVKFENDEAKNLRLYYEWDSHTKIENVIKELNQFDNVDIELKDKEIIVR